MISVSTRIYAPASFSCYKKIFKENYKRKQEMEASRNHPGSFSLWLSYTGLVWRKKKKAINFPKKLKTAYFTI